METTLLWWLVPVRTSFAMGVHWGRGDVLAIGLMMMFGRLSRHHLSERAHQATLSRGRLRIIRTRIFPGDEGGCLSGITVVGPQDSMTGFKISTPWSASRDPKPRGENKNREHVVPCLVLVIPFFDPALRKGLFNGLSGVGVHETIASELNSW